MNLWNSKGIHLPSSFPPSEFDASELSPPSTPTPTELLFRMEEDEFEEIVFLRRVRQLFYSKLSRSNQKKS